MQELDSATLKKAIKGDRNAFKTLYNLYSPFIWRVVFRMAGDTIIAKEMVQETFIKVHQSLHRFRGKSALSTWLYRIAYTTVLATLKRTSDRYRFQLNVDTIGGSERSDEFDERQLVEKILAPLSAEDRFLLIAREIDDIPFDELSLITGENSGALRTKLHRLKETIRRSYPEETVYRKREVR